MIMPWPAPSVATPAALDLSLRSIHILERMADDQPYSRFHSEQLVRYYGKLGEIYRASGRYDDARETYAKARALVEQMEAHSGRSAETLTLQASIAQSLARVAHAVAT
ncbi:MAG: tetratricopeptide repeat protein [Planctomycetota bacterium]